MKNLVVKYKVKDYYRQIKKKKKMKMSFNSLKSVKIC